jgi:hypothetical protein
MANPRIRIGEIFAIPLDDEAFGLGQVFAERAPILYLGVFSGVVKDLGSVRPSEVPEGEMILGGNFFDVLLTRGVWPILGHAPVQRGIPFPCYKVRIAGRDYVESWDGKTRREATPDELTWLEHRTNRSPAILANALRAIHGHGEWADRYNGLKAAFLLRSAEALSTVH